jgi:ASC-1-like (ASCH) protein
MRLFVPLMRQPFADFAAGTKRWEIRRADRHWGRVKPGTVALLRLGYSGRSELHRVVGRVVWSETPDELLDLIPLAEILPKCPDRATAVRLLAEMLYRKSIGPLVALEMLEQSHE